MNSILGKITPEDFRQDPFFHVRADQALEPKYYRDLADNFPDDPSIWGANWDENNLGSCLSATKATGAGAVAPVWYDFLAYHYSQAFFLEMVGLLGDQMRAAHPDLEARLNKPLESLSVAPRGSGIDADVMLDCQFGINTPVTSESRVRGFHVDNPNKLYNALLYMRTEADDSEGGQLQLCRFRGAPRLHKVVAADDDVEVVERVPYRANTLFLMINTPLALHGVSPRKPTPHVRRYVNFLAELREPIFNLGPYQKP